MKRSSVRPIVRLSVPSTDSSSVVRRVCCPASGAQISIDSAAAAGAGAQQQIWAASRQQPTEEAEHKLVKTDESIYWEWQTIYLFIAVADRQKRNVTYQRTLHSRQFVVALLPPGRKMIGSITVVIRGRPKCCVVSIRCDTIRDAILTCARKPA